MRASSSSMSLCQPNPLFSSSAWIRRPNHPWRRCSELKMAQSDRCDGPKPTPSRSKLRHRADGHVSSADDRGSTSISIRSSARAARCRASADEAPTDTRWPTQSLLEHGACTVSPGLTRRATRWIPGPPGLLDPVVDEHDPLRRAGGAFTVSTFVWKVVLLNGGAHVIASIQGADATRRVNPKIRCKRRCATAHTRAGAFTATRALDSIRVRRGSPGGAAVPAAGTRWDTVGKQPGEDRRPRERAMKDPRPGPTL
jgi:hypothetical protein